MKGGHSSLTQTEDNGLQNGTFAGAVASSDDVEFRAQVEVQGTVIHKILELHPQNDAISGPAAVAAPYAILMERRRQQLRATLRQSTRRSGRRPR